MTPKRLYVKPKHPDLVVRDPASKLPLRSEGEWVANNQYWQRRIICGDVVKTKPPASVTAAEAAEAAETVLEALPLPPAPVSPAAPVLSEEEE